MFTTRHTIDTKRKRLGLLKVAFACASALLALEHPAVAQSASGQSQGGQAAPIEGTWIFSIHRVVTGINFTALQSFTAGGVTLATGTIDQPPVSPLYGSWRRVDDNSYVATINLFVFDSAGNALAMGINNETIRLTDDNSLIGTGTGFSCDVNGDPNTCAIVPQLSITFTGKRVIAQGSSN
jgi:hypothetical protein